ncbi:response regulator [Anditalea andensis]|uniref:Response regulatory domain-containing protein n=1 Tax=Anditalea andensis TaxID=1048983 RepID=A0A074L507_9BACT|nr:response regulator [Anditalea andensis]KEO75555.1 hypothetical protein EL17_00230 [Anditalea andensis]
MKKIYLVDDQPIMNKINKRFISMLDDSILLYDFTDPKEALDMISEDNPDLVLLDLNMPVITGWDFLGILERAGKTFNVVILTSSISQQDKITSTQYSSVKGYYVKPIGKKEFSHIIENFLKENI